MNIGILGGGQLGKMLVKAAYSLGHNCIIFDPEEDCCASQICDHYCYEYSNFPKLEEFSKKVDVITYEFEHLPIETLEFLKNLNIIRPSIKALSTTQDRLKEKSLFKELGIPTVEYAAISNIEELTQFSEKYKFPFLLKSRFGGYDGKGQIEVKNSSELEIAWSFFNDKRLIAEKKITFDREVSMISSRNKNGNILYYDLCENDHEDGILRHTVNKPFDKVSEKATAFNKLILEHLEYIGTLTVEFFCIGENLIANEYAPRVHNSGHWTIEGAAVSQFENHIRAVSDLPLGNTKSLGNSVMLNLIGELPAAIATEGGNNSFYLHSYGKRPKKGRKLGHITVNSHIKIDPKICHESILVS